ncbi:alpha-L-fucosidase 2 [Paenibacillus phyllosphaerae]|uniref:Alpha-L-fucosidase 2 n=1 Tax=Paenibacillus phyllosphaerae TaxID=274593 RepID=A0A7W5AWT7_9BACL|nr:glycoside hydrolase family 95 protein [Paenibacillus phyllosphaerae]MBB3109551.1 alpha-L-fucosidase 2 [Paenibacillus phyllosphaerae]
MEPNKANPLHTLWYKQPATIWEEALPIGNGRLGGMVFGGPETERIQLNEDTLWSGFPRDTNNYEAIRHLKQSRELLLEGRYEEAEKLINDKMLSTRSEAYMAMGDMYVQQNMNGQVKQYHRELSLDTGIATTQFVDEAGAYIREAFVSSPDQVLVLRLAGQSGARINASLHLSSKLQFVTAAEAGENESTGNVKLEGKAPSHVADNYLGNHPKSVLYEETRGLSFAIYAHVSAEGGTVAVDEEGKLHVRDATSVLVILGAATNFTGFNVQPLQGSNHPSQASEEAVKAAAAVGYDQLKQRHIEEHQMLYRRAKLVLGDGNDVALPTDERIKAYASGEADPGLEALLFHYGRYLLIASSRPGTQAANLQGIWNDHVQPPWNSNYTTNINTQMNYWPAEVTALGECHEPLFDMIRELSETGSRTANIHYDCRGWTAHHNVDIWRVSTPSDGDASWAFWPLGGAWLTRHLWERYLYRPDAAFLREEAYPLLKGAALFALDWLQPLADGRLTTLPSTSPENQFLTERGNRVSVSVGSTMDLSIIRELFTHTIAAASILEIDAKLREELQDALGQMAPLPIGADGRLQEWSEPFAEAEPGHRHVSHLYGLFPGAFIHPEEEELFEASRRSLEFRISQGGGHTGWSCAWLINFYARLQDEQRAYSFVRTLLTRSIYPNLFDAHPPFQIDGNFGATSGIAEMLLQSHLNGIELLPALPEQWPSGSVVGLRARGGFSIDMAWEEGRMILAAVTSLYGSTCTIRSKVPVTVVGPDGERHAAGEPFATKAGAVYRVQPI